MSPDLERLIGRAVIDKEFRKALLDDVEQAVKAAGLNLTPDELAKVKDAAAARQKNRAGTDSALDAAKAGGWK
jgi:hypothetical protein